MVLRAKWQFMNRSVTHKIVYGPQLRFGPYIILWVTSRSINCHMALSAMNYLLIINSQIAYKGDYLSLVCAILYKYIKPLHISNLDNELVPCKIFHLSKQHNYLKERIDQQGLDKKPADMSSHLFCAIFFLLQNFPRFKGRWFMGISTSYISNNVNVVVHQISFKRWWWIWSFSE